MRKAALGVLIVLAMASQVMALDKTTLYELESKIMTCNCLSDLELAQGMVNNDDRAWEEMVDKGRCYVSEGGEGVYLVEEVTNGGVYFAKVRSPGSTKTFWTFSKALKPAKK